MPYDSFMIAGLALYFLYPTGFFWFYFNNILKFEMLPLDL